MKTFKLNKLSVYQKEDGKWAWRVSPAYVPSSNIMWFEPLPKGSRKYVESVDVNDCLIDIPEGTTWLHLSNRDDLYVTHSCEELESKMDAAQ